MTREELFKYLWALVITEGILKEGEPFSWMKRTRLPHHRRKSLLDDIAFYAERLQEESKRYHAAKVKGKFTGDFVDWLSEMALWREDRKSTIWASNLRAALRWLDSLHRQTLAAMKRKGDEEEKWADTLIRIAEAYDKEFDDSNIT
jgi:hypothetical protein